MSEALTLDLGSHVLSARSAGSGDATILCIHGFLESSRAFEPLVLELDDRWRVISLDQRGHGESTSPSAGPEWDGLAGDVVAALDILRLGRVTLIGHSMGGIVALYAALGWPERIDRLVLIATPVDVSPPQAEWLRGVAEAGRRDGLTGISRATHGDETHGEISGELDALIGMAEMMERGAVGVARRLGEIECPTLSIVGSEDPMGVSAAETVVRGVSDGLLEVIDGQGHWPHRDEPRATANRIVTFLSSD